MTHEEWMIETCTRVNRMVRSEVDFIHGSEFGSNYYGEGSFQLRVSNHLRGYATGHATLANLVIGSQPMNQVNQGKNKERALSFATRFIIPTFASAEEADCLAAKAIEVYKLRREAWTRRCTLQ